MAQHDACDLLDADHIQVERLFTQYKSARDDSKKRLLAQQIFMELTVHTQIEEEIFYPAFQRATGNNELLKDANEEHAEAKQMIARLQGPKLDDKLMLDLEDAILHHVNDEREKMFPQARKTQGLDLMDLAQQLEARKAELTVAQAA